MPTNWLKSLIQLNLSVLPYSPKYGGVSEGKLLLSHCGKCICKTGDITHLFMGFGPEIMVLAKGSVLAWGIQKSLKAFQV